MTRPSHAATYERARRLANVEVWTIALQVRRLRSKEPEDGDFHFRKWADFQFLIVALTRLRRAAVLAGKVPTINRDIQSSIQQFDTALPKLKDMRNIAEHFDAYAMEEGKMSGQDGISRRGLEVGVISDTSFQWFGHTLNSDTAMKAADKLFEAIKRAGSKVAVEKHQTKI